MNIPPKIRIISFLIVLIVFCNLCTACNQKENKTSNIEYPKEVNIGVQTLVTPELLLRLENKYDEFLNTKVNIIQFDTPSDLNKAFISGDIDFGLMGSANAASGIASGVDGEVIWLLDVIGEAEALVVRNNKKIQSLSDMSQQQDIKIGVPFVTTAHFSLLKALLNENIDVEKLQIYDMKPNDIYAAWIRGDIDAAYIWNPTLGKIIDEDGKMIISSKEVAKMGALTADVVMVRKSFSEMYPDCVVNFIKAQIYAVDKYNKDYDESIRIIADLSGLTQEEASSQVKGFTYPTASEQLEEEYFGTMQKKGEFDKVMKNTADFLAELGSLNNSPELKIFESSVNGSYIEKALGKE